MNEFKTIFERTPDVEVIFKFNGTRQNPMVTGYRPAHLVTENYLTTGVHSYNIEIVPPNGITEGTITFITPEAYPRCLWVGKELSIQEGERVVGVATVTKIMNPLLEKTL